jgi:argininosuccinate lyase
VKLVAAAMRTAEFDAARLEARAAEGWTTLTELADTLVRDHGVPFRSAHAVAARLIAARQRDPKTPLAALLADVSTELLGAPVQYSDTALARILSPRHFVDVRRTSGGPAPVEPARATAVARALLEEDQAWWTNTTDALTAAEQRLTDRAARL